MGVTMRAAAMLILGCLVSTSAFAGMWSNLWRTPDQQGEALLAAGRPAQAAARFTSPRRKAYADLEADHYAQAARLLAPFKGPTSEYNRGNALAHLGHLHAALADYDAALKQAPHDRDIRHNRNLLERILAHRPPNPPAPKHGGAGARQGQRGSRQRAGQGKSKRNGQRGSGQQGAGQHQRAKQARNSPQNTPRHGKPTTPSGAQQGGQRSPSAARANGHDNGQHAGSARQRAALAHPRGHSPGRARRDAAAAAAIARRQRRESRYGSAGKPAQLGPHKGARSLLGHSGAERTRPPKPVSEKTLALDQWLRQIPNNPAGLLRRKFLIEYMLRHPGANR